MLFSCQCGNHRTKRFRWSFTCYETRTPPNANLHILLEQGITGLKPVLFETPSICKYLLVRSIFRRWCSISTILYRTESDNYTHVYESISLAHCQKMTMLKMAVASHCTTAPGQRRPLLPALSERLPELPRLPPVPLLVPSTAALARQASPRTYTIVPSMPYQRGIAS